MDARTGRRIVAAAVLVGFLRLFPAGETAWAQRGSVSREARLAAFEMRLRRFQTFASRMAEARRKGLSGAARNMLHLAERWNEVAPGLRTAPRNARALRGMATTSAPAAGPVRSVSDPSTDVAFSSFSGFTQNETSTAWCGSNVVVGFNDSGSLFESLLFGTGGLSFDGLARSSDRGRSFQDLGFLNPGADLDNLLFGDPVVACTDPETFYFASIFFTDAATAISVSKSTDGGATFQAPVVAASKDDTNHFLDKPWMAVDPTDPNDLYVTYTDFDDSLSSSGCGSDSRTAIELVRSTDGGASWSDPVVIDEVCGDEFDQGSQVAVGPSGEVYVAWEFFGEDFATRELRIRKSSDGAATFGPSIKVADVACVGNCFLLQGAFRSGFELPSLAVDRSDRATRGNVYLTWHDGGSLTVSDALSGAYGVADVLMSRSTDGGSTWSPPTRVNDNPDPVPGGFGTDQYQPAIAVDRKGTVGICFYDRRMDPANFLIDRFCALSADAGASWKKNKRVTTRRFSATPGQDLLLDPAYMGDYDTLASDFTLGNAGFIGAWGDNSRGNPDVMAAKAP
jgi:hypothetical protein